MRAVILGGYGVFGFRLAQLLARDGHDLWLAGRSPQKAQAAAQHIGAKTLTVDRQDDLTPIFTVRPDVVIDAAGPFQSYGTDPYRLAQHCIEENVNYLDLSDDADFTAGIVKLDDAARKRGRWVLSGVSSVPGLSSTAAHALACGFDEVLAIDTAILPGNKAPRGVSVMSSIVGQIGRTMRLWRGGVWRQARGWTDRRRYRLAADLVRDGYLVRVPDVQLFSSAFKARSVTFRAGMELSIMNASLTVLSKLRRRWRLDASPHHIRMLQRLASYLLPLGTDRGGMQTTVTGRKGDTTRQRSWTLVASDGDGPFIPGVVARALLRKPDRIPPGARPALCEVPLAEIEEAMSDLAVTVETAEVDSPTLFQTSLGERWIQLPSEIRDLHSVQDLESFSGHANITRGSSVIARFAAWLFGFPPEGENVPVTVTITRTDKGEVWERNFDGAVFKSLCMPSPLRYRYRERFGMFTFEQDLPVDDGRMGFVVRRGWLLGLPLPNFLLPGSNSAEFAEHGAFHFDVALSAPIGGGLIVRYRGVLTPDRAAGTAQSSGGDGRESTKAAAPERTIA